MIKRAAVLLVGAGCFLGAAAVSATPFDDCVKNLAKTKVDNMLSDDDHAICLKQESARLLAEVQKVYTQIANDKAYSSWNKGNGMFKGRVRDTYNAWLVYRNNYCSLLEFAAQGKGVSNAFVREQCLMQLTEEQLEDVNKIISAYHNDPD